MNRSERHKPWGVLVLTLFLSAACAWIYWHGIEGPFILDDSGNLGHLSMLHKSNEASLYLAFILEGQAGELGRPLSLATFALQAEHWPENPAPFKIVNIIIHLLNGALVFLLLHLLLKQTSFDARRALMITTITSAAWLLHPLHVSTVLYVVQRMTELSTLFVLLGLVGYLVGRRKLQQETGLAGYLWISISVAAGTLCATLSKENGALLPLFVILIELLFFKHKLAPREVSRFRVWQLIFLYLPCGALFIYMLVSLPAFHEAYLLRNYNLSERLLTQAHALGDYLLKIFLPNPRSYNLFQDDFPISHSLTNPIGTLLGLLTIVALSATAYLCRSRAPLITFGILFFFCGHLLESSIVPLELYFEHRNYLPSLGILLAACSAVLMLSQRFNSHAIIKKCLKFSSLFVIMVLAANTLILSKLWGNGAELALTWAETKPNSIRAQSNAYNLALFHQQYEQGLHYLDNIKRLSGNDPTPELIRLHLNCLSGRAYPIDTEEMARLIGRGDFSRGTLNEMQNIVASLTSGACEPGFNEADIENALQGLLNNEHYKHVYGIFFQLHASIKARQKDYAAAAVLLEKALTEEAHIGIALERVRLMTLGNDHRGALLALQSIDNNQLDYPQKIIWQNKINEWEHFLRDQLALKDQQKQALPKR